MDGVGGTLLRSKQRIASDPIGGLNRLTGAAVSADLTGLLMQLLGVIFTISAHGLAVLGREA